MHRHEVRGFDARVSSRVCPQTVRASFLKLFLSARQNPNTWKAVKRLNMLRGVVSAGNMIEMVVLNDDADAGDAGGPLVSMMDGYLVSMVSTAAEKIL